jgi:CelD/BcsL family acetyltransferase involved in cellulose biosynthesis
VTPTATTSLAVAATFKIDVIHDATQFSELRSEWNAVLQASRANTIFLTWEWVATWWEVYGRDGLLYVIVARDRDGHLIGIAPFHLSAGPLPGLNRRDTLRFIGDGGDVTPEYLDVIAIRDREREVVEAFTHQICEDPEVRAIDLRPLAEDSCVRKWGLSLLSKGSGIVRCLPESECPVLSLPASADAFIASRSHNYRKKLGEYDRRCRRDFHANFRMSRTDEERRRDMASLVKLHQQRWNGHSSSFRSAKYISFHEKLSSRLLERGWLRLFSIDSSSAPAAVLYCFAHCGRYSFYQAGRDPIFQKHRVGLVIMHKAILEAISEGATVFDFLRGTEQYKYRWAQANVSSLRLVYWKNLRAQLKGTIQDAFRQLSLSWHA